jgi:hypothetical protein
MFTITQIKEAHSKVKSGADFPAYIQGLISNWRSFVRFSGARLRRVPTKF